MNPFLMNNLLKNNTADLLPECRRLQQSLSEYMDNTLSARQVWEVEKHLAACKECSAASRQMQATVQLLHSVDRFDTGDDFMAKLHARLDGFAPEPARRRGVTDWAQGVFESLRSGVTQQRLPALNFGMAAAGVAVLLFFVPQSLTVGPNSSQGGKNDGIIKTVLMTDAMHDTNDNLQRNVALTANDPLGDVAAENLENMQNSVGNNAVGTSTTKSGAGMDGG